MTNRARSGHAGLRVLAVLWALALIAALPATVLAGGPPSNDNFGNAKLIVGSLPYSDSISTSGASVETGEPEGDCDSSTDHSVWYKITMTRNRAVQVNTIGSNYDTVIDIFTGTTLSNLNLIDCNSDIDSNNPDLYSSRVTFNAQAGQRYFIRVTDSDEDAGGMLQLRVRTVQRPGNDHYANAKAITSLPFDTNADNTNATRQDNEPDDNYCDVARASRWYKFTPNQDMVIWANTFVPVDFDTVLGVYTGNTIGNAQQVICNDDTWVSNDISYASGVTFKAHAGVTYRFQVAGYDGETGGNRRLPFHVERVTPVANDDFANAEFFDGVPFERSVNMRRTTVQTNEPAGTCMNAITYNTAWYEFAPSTTATYEATASGINDAQSTVIVYEVGGPGFGGLTEVGCGDNVSFTGNSGTTYMLQITNDNTHTAPIHLEVDLD